MAATPGPWEYENGTVTSLANGLHQRRVGGYHASYDTICRLDDGENIWYADEAEKVANGHLLAAAPFMRDKLREILDMVYTAAANPSDRAELLQKIAGCAGSGLDKANGQ